ncbi:hypothetical protein QUB05_26465 [Microcoleus sp. F10-C6]|uniref:hypothetical protein n=1 Tax=unclassified Microcoleus TaxID=2642155 RepID=UPI002FCFC1A8
MGNGELIFLIPSSSMAYIRYINCGVTGIDINGGHGNALSLPQLIVGKRHCRVLMVRVRTRLRLWGNINSDATEFDITFLTSEESESVAEIPSSSIRYISYIARCRTSSPL